MTDVDWLLILLTPIITKCSPYAWYYSKLPLTNDSFINRFTFETPYFNPIDKFNIIIQLTEILNDHLHSASYNLFWLDPRTSQLTSDINTTILLHKIELPVICLDILQLYSFKPYDSI